MRGDSLLVALVPLLISSGAGVAASPLSAATEPSPASRVSTAPALAIVGATIYPVVGPKLDRATVIIVGDRIQAVGRDLAVPPGTRILDGRGKIVTPGFVDPLTTLGLADVPSEADASDLGIEAHDRPIRAAYVAADALNPRSFLLPIARKGGICAVVVAPAEGLVAGQAAWLELAGDGHGTEGTIARSPLAIFASLGTPTRAVAGGSFGGQLLALREALDDAREYDVHRAQFEANGLHKLDESRLDLEALVAVVRGREPLYLEVHRASEIEAALRLATDEKIELVLAGGEEGWMVADAIAAAKVPLVIDPFADLPYTFDSLGARLDNAAILARAGVELAFTTGTETEGDPPDPRTLRQRAGVAVANGLPWDLALAALTRGAADAFGMTDRGRIVPGAVADLVVWSGDPLELSSVAEHVIIGGVEQSLRSHQSELLDRYRGRDLDAASSPASRPVP